MYSDASGDHKLRSSSDEGTVSHRAGDGKNNDIGTDERSTPDITYTGGGGLDDNPKLANTTIIPNVPEGALAASPNNRRGGGGDRPTSGGLPHPYIDEYTTATAFVGGGSFGTKSPQKTSLGHQTSLGHHYTQQHAGSMDDTTDAGSGNEESGGIAMVADASHNSYGGNPFVASSDDEMQKRNREQVRRVKASSPAKYHGQHSTGSKQTTPDGGEGSTMYTTTTTTVYHPVVAVSPTYDDFGSASLNDDAAAARRQITAVDDDTIGGGGSGVPTVVAGGRRERSTSDPFVDQQGLQPTLEKHATALQDDPFTDDGYYRNVPSAEGPPTDREGRLGSGGSGGGAAGGERRATDPFAHFGNYQDSNVFGGGEAGSPLMNGTGRNSSGSFMRSNGSIVRRQSQYGAHNEKKEQDRSLNAGSHSGNGGGGGARRQSVALALSNPKPKQRAEEMRTTNAGPIEVISTMATKDQNSSPGSKHLDVTSAEDTASVDKAAEQLFMPNLKREQYIPVRVAREKIKMILAEMAQMKSMHLGAIDTMEKQHQFLKAQLETACAAYCRKLTSDYNNRVVALNDQFKRKLANEGIKLPRSRTPEVNDLTYKLRNAEQSLAAKHVELDRAIQSTQSSLEMAEEADGKHKASVKRIRLLEEEVAALRLEAQEQQDVHEREQRAWEEERAYGHRQPTSSPPPLSDADAAEIAASRQRVHMLESDLEELQRRLDESNAALRDAQEQHQQQLLAAAQSPPQVQQQEDSEELITVRHRNQTLEAELEDARRDLEECRSSRTKDAAERRRSTSTSPSASDERLFAAQRRTTELENELQAAQHELSNQNDRAAHHEEQLRQLADERDNERRQVETLQRELQIALQAKSDAEQQHQSIAAQRRSSSTSPSSDERLQAAQRRTTELENQLQAAQNELSKHKEESHSSSKQNNDHAAQHEEQLRQLTDERDNERRQVEALQRELKTARAQEQQHKDREAAALQAQNDSEKQHQSLSRQIERLQEENKELQNRLEDYEAANGMDS